MAEEGSRVPAQITLFGFEPTTADVAVVRRSRGWRWRHALLALGLCWVLVPVVIFIPPHIPWAAGAFILGIVLAYRRATEEYTLTHLEGTCPKCGHAQTLEKPTKLKRPHPLSCGGCHNDLQLRVEAEAAPSAADADAEVDADAGSHRVA